MISNQCTTCKKSFKKYTDLAFHIIAGCVPKTEKETK